MPLIKFKSEQYITAIYGSEKYESEDVDDCYSRGGELLVSNLSVSNQDDHVNWMNYLNETDEHGEVNLYFDPVDDGNGNTIVELCVPVRHLDLVDGEVTLTDDVIGTIEIVE